jgi:centromere DNA-binding complex CBF3 subunit-like protein
MEAFRPHSRRNRVQRLDLAGSGFLRLLRVLRTVVLQDSVGLRRLFPDHPIWKADVFASEAYQTFATKVAAACEVGEEPEDLQLKKVLPALYDKITMMHQDLKQSVKVAVREAVQEVQAGYDARFNAEMRELQATMQDFSSGRRSFTVRANPEVDSGNAPGPSQSMAVSSDPTPSS